MSDRQRIPFHYSSSFSDMHSSGLNRSLKRHLTAPSTDSAYFTPSTSMFSSRYSQSQQLDLQNVPKEPTPPSSSAPPSTRSHVITRHTSIGVNGVQVLDPSLSDPGALFIHPPFTEFPDADKHKDGLTYNLMATNPEWFLDPADFISAINDNPNAIRYPPQLEPPRGWCPAKKKELKDSWPEGEEPRLRCTFCRRTYAGVNAKSMWRRHVYEKHKIAMANRRDTSDRKGTRCANKENKDDGRMVGRRGSSDGDDDVSQSRLPRSSTLGGDGPSGSSNGHDYFNLSQSSSTPPLTPGHSPFKSGSVGDTSIESPYNPLSTPSFRHSPARLPSAQPWRFPSPSHPLHSKVREISLAMLVRDGSSPLVSGLDVSPSVLAPTSERAKRSLFSSPLVAPGNKDEDVHVLSVPSPAPFFDTPFPLPLAGSTPLKDFKLPSSPAGFPTHSSPKQKLASLTDVIRNWHSNTPSSPMRPTLDNAGLLDPIELTGDESFTASLYESWIDLSATTDESSEQQNASSRVVDESPVVRSNPRGTPASAAKTMLSGLGTGLMDAFLSGRRKAKARTRSRTASAGDDDGLFQRNGIGKRNRHESWYRDDETDGELDPSQHRKRRKTVNGRN